MQLYTVDGWLYFITDVFFQGFTWLTILLMIARWLPFTAIRNEAAKVNASKNLLMTVAGILMIVSTGILLLNIYTDQTVYEFVFIKYSLAIYWVQVLGSLLASIIMISFYWHRPRNSWWLTGICLLLLHAGWLIENFGGLHKNDQASSWEIEEQGIGLVVLQVLVFAVLTACVYWVLYWKKNKLKPKQSN